MTKLGFTMEVTQYAPVLIPTLNRYVHFKRCVESLSACKHAEKTELIVALDFPLKDSHREGYELIKTYITTIHGFNKVSVIERERNYGAIQNFFQSIEYVFRKYDSLIYTEDDNYMAPNFLSFVNNGLINYEHRSDVFSISGYNSPFNMPPDYKNDVYLRVGFSAWGVGIWKNKWEKVDWTMKEFNSFIDKKSNLAILKKFSERSYSQFLRMRKDNILIADGIVAIHLVMNNMYSIYPVISRVRNNGHDGSGENCGISKIYSNQKLYDKEEDAIFSPDIQPDFKLLQYVQKQYKLPWMKWMKQRIPSECRVRIKWFINKK